MSAAPRSRTLVVDADDTLWENNIYFEDSIEEFIDHLDHSTLDRAGVRQALAEVERATIVEHGYGSDSFARSLRACFALHAERQPTEGDLAVLTMLGRRIVEQPVQLLDGVVETLELLHRRHRLVLLTKGQPDEQQVKIERSGLQRYFSRTRVVPEKTRETYVALLDELGSSPDETWMIGNSPRSDINPALAAGMHAVYVPHRSTWVLEQQDLDPGHERLHVVDRFEALVPLFLRDPGHAEPGTDTPDASPGPGGGTSREGDRASGGGASGGGASGGGASGGGATDSGTTTPISTISGSTNGRRSHG